MFNKFKSSETPDLYLLKHLIDLLLYEQKCQRADLSTIKRQLHTIITSSKLQTQVDDYFKEDSKDIPEDEDGT